MNINLQQRTNKEKTNRLSFLEKEFLLVLGREIFDEIKYVSIRKNLKEEWIVLIGVKEFNENINNLILIKKKELLDKIHLNTNDYYNQKPIDISVYQFQIKVKKA